MKAVIHTNKGDITVELFPKQAPMTVKNFVDLSLGQCEWVDPRTGKTTSDPLYKDLIFHRIIAGFMIQGGDPTGTGTGGPGYRFGDEFDMSLSFNEPYILAMANAGPSTNGSQFFITVAATPWLNGQHTIFGKVADEESRKVVDEISNVETGPMDRPVDDVVLKSIDIVEGEEA